MSAKNTAEKKPATKPYTHLTTAQKAEALSLWKSGNITLAELSIRFKRSERTFARLFAKENVKKGETAEEHSKVVAAEVEKSIVDDAGELARKIKEVKDEHFKMSRGISKLVWAEIIEARKAERPISTAAKNLQALEKAAQTLRITREEAYVVLGIADGEKSDPDDLPELRVSELTDEAIKNIQKDNVQSPADENDVVDLPDLNTDLETVTV